jgi:amino acid transporter
MGLRDVVLFHIVAIVGLRWLLTAANLGPASVGLWLAAVLLFFVPQGMAVLELSARMPEEGGIYVWTREAFGPLHGFICGWAYWVNNLIYYPSLIVFIAGNAVLALGSAQAPVAGLEVVFGDFGQTSPWLFQVGLSLTVLWIAVGLNIVGLKSGRWVQNTGGVATWIAVGVLVALAAAALLTGRADNPLTGVSLIPDLSGANINLWSSLCFALAGLELASVMGGEVKEPSRTLPRSILMAAPMIAVIYIVGTLAVLTTSGSEEVDLIRGIVDAISETGALFGLPLTRVAAVLILLTGLGGLGAWLAGAARIPFVVGLDRYLPAALGKVHPKWQTPYVALLVQGVGATVFLLFSVLGSTIEEAYLILVDTTIIVYFIPYVYLFLAVPVLRRRASGAEQVFRIPWGGLGLWLVVIAGVGTTVVSIVLATLPGPEGGRWFFLKVGGGAVGLMVVGLVFYATAVWRQARQGANG